MTHLKIVVCPLWRTKSHDVYCLENLKERDYLEFLKVDGRFTKIVVSDICYEENKSVSMVEGEVQRLKFC